MPTNLYGPNDNYDLSNSHVLPALIRKFHEAKLRNQPTVTIWGSGTPRREFLYADDLADACYFLMQQYNGGGFVNIGSGKDIQIQELARLIKKITGFGGDIQNDLSKPDGTPQNLLDISKITRMGWKPWTELEMGIKKVYGEYVKTADAVSPIKAL